MNIFWVEISLEKKLGRDLFGRDVVGRDSFADLFVEISLGSVLVKVEFFCFFLVEVPLQIRFCRNSSLEIFW